MTTKRVLVTGAGGLIGTAVCRVLCQRGWNVLAVSRRPTSFGASAGVALDLTEVNLVARLPSRPDVVVHLAAMVPDGSRVLDDESAAACTRSIDARVFEAAAAWGAHLVYASGCSLYDNRNVDSKTEDAELTAESYYLRAKLEGDLSARQLPRSCIMRISAPVGSGLKPSTVLARFVQRARENGVLHVWGSGRREQDFVAVSDVAEFVDAAIRLEATGIFNVAAGRPTTMRELAGIVCKTLGSGSISVNQAPDPLEGRTARFSIAAARKVLDWAPKVSLPWMIASLSESLEAR